MLLLKRLLLANVLGAGIVVPSVTLTKSGETPERLELGTTLKRWNQLLDHISGKDTFEKISKVFSRNLTTFSKSAVVNAVKHILMKWATEIWEKQEDYFPISQRLNKFFFYYHIHHWNVKKEIEDLSWELIKKFFIDFFFKNKGWFLLENFGDFSSFVLEEWEKKERPMKVYEWNLKYSNAGESQQSTTSENNLYDKSVLEGAKGQPAYLFPQIQASEEYSSFISKFTHTGEVDLSHFKKSWKTVSELSTLTDGYKLGSLIHLYTKKNSWHNNESSTNETQENELELTNNSQEVLKASDNPLYLFLKANNETSCLSIQNSLFNEEIKSKLKDNKFICLYGTRWLTTTNGNGSNDNSDKKKILVSRELDGISFYYLTKESGLKSETNDEERTEETNNTKKSLDQQEPEVIEKVTKYVEENFENLFLKFLFSKKNSNNTHQVSTNAKFSSFSIKSSVSGRNSNKTWDFSEFLSPNLKILEASTEYLDALYWGQTVKKLQSILLSVYTNIPKEFETDEEEDESERIKLPTKVGLFSPLTYKRSKRSEDSGGESETQETNGRVEEIDFFKLRENGENEEQNSRFFEDIITFLFGKEKDQQILSLEGKAHKLRELFLGEKGEEEAEKKLFGSNLDNLFLNESFYRTQLETIAGDKLKASHTIFVSKSKDILSSEKSQEESKENNNFSGWLTKLINSLEPKRNPEETTSSENNTQSSQKYQWTDLINKSLFLEPFLKSPLEKKIFYATIEQVSSEGAEEAEEEVSSSNGLTIRAKNDWILDNFYLSDAAYESSSDTYQEFLAYLVSMKWMTNNNYANMVKVLNYILSKNGNKNAYLVWTKEITEKQKEVLEKASETSTAPKPVDTSSQEQPKPEDELKKFLEKEQFSSDISNPLLRENFKSNNGAENDESSSATQSFSSESSIYKVEAFKNGNGASGSGDSSDQKTKLSGFGGLVTESFSTRELPKVLKDYLFKEFLKLNSPENKNYSSAGSSEQTAKAQQKKFVEGVFFAENQSRNLTKNDEILGILKNVRRKDKLLKYFDDSNNSLKSVLGDEAKNIDSLTIEELRKKLEEKLKTSENQLVSGGQQGENSEIKDIYKLFNRFSGYIYSSSQKEKSPYVFSETKEGTNEKKYYIGFVYQVNQFDFQKEGIEAFKRDLSEDTLNTLVSLLASNKEIRDWIYNGEIIKQLSL